MIREKVVIYLRLSKEDGDDESSSISNQRKILTEYAEKNGFEIVDEYVDDGESGYTMSRPDFNRLKKDLNYNKVHTVLVKDTSRIGRHNARVQLFLENILEDGKRVITVSEGYDTMKPETHKYIGLHTWVNESFIIETSQKIKASIKSLQKEGKWLCNVPYGYIKDKNDKYKYYIDETTAPYVKLIFDLYINGDGINAVAKKITEMNVPTPSMIKKMNAESNGKQYKGAVRSMWDQTAIRRIIKNEFYIGTLVLGKTKARSINGKQVDQSRENMHVFENAHESIIDKQTFELAQELIKRRRNNNYRGDSKQKSSIFSRMLECADCGKLLVVKGKGIGDEAKYCCRTYNSFGSKYCAPHTINEYELKLALMEFLEYCSNNLTSIIEDIDNIIAAEIKVKSNRDEPIAKIMARLESTKKSTEILIEQKVRETMKNPLMVDMIDKMYDEALNEKYKEIQALEKQLNDQSQFAQQEIELKKNLSSALNIVNDIITSGCITQKQVLLLVEKIVVYEDTGIDIYLKGDLHKVADNYFKIGEKKLDAMKQLLYDFIVQNPKKFALVDAVVYMREHGINTAHRTISKLFKEKVLNNGMAKIRKSNHGYELTVTTDELKSMLIPCIVDGRSRWLQHNSEIFDVLVNISNWVNIIEDTKKDLF
jgi:DNA invertase Pin-like site-specific DNA recombinase